MNLTAVDLFKLAGSAAVAGFVVWALLYPGKSRGLLGVTPRFAAIAAVSTAVLVLGFMLWLIAHGS